MAELPGSSPLTPAEHERIERAKYERAWATTEYRERSPGLRIAPTVFRYFDMKPEESLFDWGCGTGRAAKWFQDQGLRVLGVDFVTDALEEPVPFVNACLWDLHDRFIPRDWSFCCDVLEHIPEPLVDKAARDIVAVTRRGAFFKVADTDSPCGEDELHVTRMPLDRWLALLDGWMEITHHEPGDRPNTLNVYGRPR